MSILKALLVCFLLCGYSRANNYTYTSVPGRVQGQDAVYVVAVAGQNATVSCNITNTSTGDSITPLWTLYSTNGWFNLSFNVSTGLLDDDIALPIMSSGNGLTILNYTEEFTRVTCGPLPGVVSENFVFGILNPPLLITNLNIDVIEGRNETIDLVMPNNDTFPPYYAYMWSFNGQGIVNNSSIIMTDHSLSLINIQRSQAGTYSISVYHASGNYTGNFSLNVQFAPSGILADSVVYGRIGGNISLTLFKNLSGNPFPVITWTFNGTSISNNLSQLVLMNITSDRFGLYTANASNIVGSITSNVTLIEAKIPGAPLNLESSNVTHTSAIIQWTEPSNTGAPSLTGYMVIVYPTVQGSPFFTNDTNIVINGLTPSDDYIISVVAISAFYPQGGSKANITIATVEGPPEFNTVDVVVLSNGNIRISLELRHAGGYDHNDVSIDGYCSTDIDYMIGSASGQMEANAFTYSCDTQCIDEQLETSFSFGAATAGTLYYCSVIASNMIGSATQRNNLVPLIGKPSKPVVTATTSPGAIRVYFSCQFSGILAGNKLVFNVTITAGSQADELYTMRNEYSDYANNTNRSIAVTVSGGTTYQIEVVAMNEYGYSELSRIGPINVTANATVEPTEPESTRLLIIIVAASVGGLLLAVVCVSIIICICGCCIRKKRTRTLQFPTTSTQTWKRGDVRAMELSQRKHAY